MSHGDDEHPISFRFSPERRGEHVHVEVRAGNREAGRAVVGTLVMRSVEWAAFRALVETAPATDPEAARRLRDHYGSIPTDLRHSPGLDHLAAAVVLAYETGGVRTVIVDERPIEIDAFGLAAAAVNPTGGERG